MKEILAKCGCDCINCPTYKDNILTMEARKRCSKSWEKYLNIKLSPEKLRPCDGCSIADSERESYYLNCKVRKCAILNGVENCAYCTGFPCDELKKVHSLQHICSREEFMEKKNLQISENDYKAFIEPYLGLYHLFGIRKNISFEDFKDYKKFSTKIKFAGFINSTDKNLKKIYVLLTNLFVEKNIPYARLLSIENKRKKLIEIIWTIGCYGTLNEVEKCIELTSETYLSHKLQGMHNCLLEYFNVMEEYGFNGEIIPIIEKGWLTPTGGLRKNGWKLRFWTPDNSPDTLKILKDYIYRLDTKYGKKAIKFFNTADLKIMIN